MATSSDSEGAARFVGRAPFLMVLTDLAVKGIVFVLLNAGLLRAVLNGEHFLSFTALLLRGVIDPAVRMAGKVDSVAALALLFVVCAVGGWILAALDTLFSTVLGWLATVVTYRVRRRRKFKEHERPFFSAPWVLDAHYAALLIFSVQSTKGEGTLGVGAVRVLRELGRVHERLHIRDTLGRADVVEPEIRRHDSFGAAGWLFPC